MRNMKWLTPLFLVFFIFLLSACGSSLEKPTGLEDEGNEQHELKDENNKEAATENQDEDEAKEKGSIKEKVASDSKKDEESKSKVSTDSNPKTGKSISNKQKSSDEEADSGSKGTQKEKVSSDKSTKSISENSSKSIKGKQESSKESTGKNDKSKSSTNEKSVEKESKPKPTPTPKPKPKNTIVHSIVISSSEVPMPPTELEIKDGDTVLDALKAITQKHGVQMDYKGSGGTGYVKGMGNVYEFDRGQGSGWMYRVNGVFPDRGAGTVPLKGGDRVEWLYTMDLGKDLGANLQPFR